MPVSRFSAMPDELADLLPLLARQAQRLTDNPCDAADLAQEAALKIWQRYHSGDTIADPRAYAMTTLRNISRAQGRAHVPTDPLAEDVALSPPDAPRMIACAELRAAIDRLPEDQALLLRMVMAGESRPRALARRLGVRSGTVMARLARARDMLRQEMGMTRTCSITTLFEEEVRI